MRRLRLRADALDDSGAGVATAPDGAPVHVAGLLPGEEADVAVVHRSPHSGARWTRVLRRHTAAPERVVPVCGGYGRCGGCVLQHLSYPAQLRFKQERLARALAAAGVAAPVAPCVAREHPPGGLGYRSRAKFAAGPGPAGLVLGAYAPRSHEIVDMTGCRVVTPRIAAGLRALVRISRALGLSPYDERTGSGQLRYLLLRDTAAGELGVSLVCGTPPPQEVLEELLARLRRDCPEVASVVLHENRLPGNVLLPPETAQKDRVLFGAAALWDQVGDLFVRVSPRAFLQINRAVAERLYADVAAALQPAPADRLLDLYCGVGGIGLTLARAAPGLSVLGVEESPDAVADAEASASGFSAERVRFQAGDAAQVLSALVAAGERFSLAVLNPPRRGCDVEVLQHLIALGPSAMAYVSCDPRSLARDLGRLSAAGYRLLRVTPYDMHPHTPHVEALALLTR
jgi:23S rRNA (uracil1939-C5)-methyltransferase